MPPPERSGDASVVASLYDGAGLASERLLLRAEGAISICSRSLLLGAPESIEQLRSSQKRSVSRSGSSNTP